jgi:hypothetical protein
MDPAPFATGGGADDTLSWPQPPSKTTPTPTPSDIAIDCTFMVRPPNTVRNQARTRRCDGPVLGKLKLYAQNGLSVFCNWIIFIFIVSIRIYKPQVAILNYRLRVQHGDMLVLVNPVP